MTGKAVSDDSPGAACVQEVSEATTPAPGSRDGHTSDWHKKVGSKRVDAPFYSECIPDNTVLAEAESLEQAKRIYIGKREWEDNQQLSKTLHNTAKGNYRGTLEADRHLRQSYANPSVVLLTLCANPVSQGEWVPPLDYTEAVGNALSNVLARLRQLLDSYSWEYVAVRGGSKQGASNWHVVLWVDGHPSLEEFAPAVESFINNCVVATPKQNPLDEAVKINTTPSSDLEAIGKLDVELGEVSPIARYVAGQIPHVSPVAELTEAEALQGTLEWASNGHGFRCSTEVQQV